MNSLQTTAIVLARTDFGEADRIITLLTPEYGKLRLLAKGVRKVKSKLAGGIELFSVSQISFLQGRGEVGTLVSTRLIRHYGHIVTDINRVQLGYELIKMLNKATEDQPEAEYFELLNEAFVSLDDASLDLALVRLWFAAQLLRLAGHRPNLSTDTDGEKLSPEKKYDFDYEGVAFREGKPGSFGANHIKFLRLVFSGNVPAVLAQVQGAPELTAAAQPLVQTMLTSYIRI